MNSQLPKHTVDQLTPILVGLIRFIDDDTLPSEADIALLLMGVDIEPNPTVLREILRWDDILRAAVDNPSKASRVAAVEALKLRGLPEASVLLTVDELASAYFPSSPNSSNGGLYVDASELHFEVPPETVIEKSLQVSGGAGVVRAVGDHIYVSPHQFEAKPTRIYVGVGPLELGDVVFSEIRFICAAETATVVVFAECKQPPDDHTRSNYVNGVAKKANRSRTRKRNSTTLIGVFAFVALIVPLLAIASWGSWGDSLMQYFPWPAVTWTPSPSPTPILPVTPTQSPQEPDENPVPIEASTAVVTGLDPRFDEGIDIDRSTAVSPPLPATIAPRGSHNEKNLDAFENGVPTIMPTPRVTVDSNVLSSTISPPRTCKVTSLGLNLRPGPGSEYGPPIDELSLGEEVEAIGRNSVTLWLKVVARNSDTLLEGWVSPNHVRCDFQLGQLPEIPWTK